MPIEITLFPEGLWTEMFKFGLAPLVVVLVFIWGQRNERKKEARGVLRDCYMAWFTEVSVAADKAKTLRRYLSDNAKMLDDLEAEPDHPRYGRWRTENEEEHALEASRTLAQANLATTKLCLVDGVKSRRDIVEDAFLTLQDGCKSVYRDPGTVDEKFGRVEEIKVDIYKLVIDSGDVH